VGRSWPRRAKRSTRGRSSYETTPQIVHTFRVRNPTDRVVRVKQIRRSCTCTDAAISKEVIALGEAVDLTMKVNARPNYNEWLIDCSLETDHPEWPWWTYWVSFRTYPRARFNVATISLGDVPAKRNASTTEIGHRQGDSL